MRLEDCGRFSRRMHLKSQKLCHTVVQPASNRLKHRRSRWHLRWMALRTRLTRCARAAHYPPRSQEYSRGLTRPPRAARTWSHRRADRDACAPPAAAASAFFSEIAQGASAKTVWRSMRAEQVSIEERWRRPRSELIWRARSDTGQAAEKCSRGFEGFHASNTALLKTACTSSRLSSASISL